jgi:divalent metal cation (Fe/Co/Zn/Cd) transporter
VLATSVYGLLSRSQADVSPVGIGISAAAAIVMPYLWFAKRPVAKRLGSRSLRGDAASSLTCRYMASTVLVGLVLSGLFHWWWAEDVAALVFLFWLAGETKEAFEEARDDDADDAE